VVGQGIMHGAYDNKEVIKTYLPQQERGKWPYGHEVANDCKDTYKEFYNCIIIFIHGNVCPGINEMVQESKTLKVYIIWNV
jgi:hypothetical protein